MSTQGAIVITGANGNVGAAVAARLRGTAPLALFERSGAPVTRGEGGTTFGSVELGDEASVAAGLARVHAELGPVRALVHTVGGYADGHEVQHQPLEVVRRMIDLNFVNAVNTVHALLPDILAADEGRIVLFASGDALRGRAGASAYAASKAALVRFAEALAEEVTPKRVGVRVIVPTTIDTPQNRAAMPGANTDNWVTPAEIAEVVAFAVAPESRGVRFALLPVGR